MTQGGIAGLILAAGESSRMGKDKALLTYRGRSFLEGIIQSLREAGLQQTIVVLGHHAREIQSAAILEGVQIVLNEDYRLGQTSSLQAGLGILDAGVIAILLCLVDHPAVNPETLRKLCRMFWESGAPIVIPTHEGRRGHPVIIGQALFQDLLNLKPESGANEVIRRFREQTVFLEVHDPGILLDVDSPKDYAHFESWPKRG
ncbi:MAG: nucleotidyltransferase family protein [Terriglobia bacterium]